MTTSDAVQLSVLLNAVAIGLCISGFVCCWFIEHHWTSLMQIADIDAWPPLTGYKWTCASLGGIYVLASIIAIGRERWQLNPLLVASTLTLGLALMGLYAVVTIDCPSSAAMEALASQIPVHAVGSFNRGVCSAWCRAHYTVSLSGAGPGFCGEPPSVVATSYAPDAVGQWCQQAIQRDSFQANASYRGKEPFTTMTQTLAVCVPGTWLMVLIVVVAVIVSVCGAVEFFVIEAVVANVRRSASAALPEPEGKTNTTLAEKLVEA